MTVSPTCIVAFADNEVTRMTVWDGDIARAVRLARAAYASRKGHPAPDIIAMQFVTVDGEHTDLLSGLELGLMLALRGMLDEAMPSQRGGAR